jgi:hypothetical protein
MGALNGGDGAWHHILACGVVPTLASLKQRALGFRTEASARRSGGATRGRRQKQTSAPSVAADCPRTVVLRARPSAARV